MIPARFSCSRSCSITSLSEGCAATSLLDDIRGSLSERYHVRGTGGEYGTAQGTPNPRARLPPGKPRIMLRHLCQSTASQIPSANAGVRGRLGLGDARPDCLRDMTHNHRRCSCSVCCLHSTVPGLLCRVQSLLSRANCSDSISL